MEKQDEGVLPLQRIRMTKSLITEFGRCKKSFVLSLFWHGLDNETLSQKGGVLPDSMPTYNARRDMICNNREIADAIASAKDVVQIDCSGSGMQAKLDQTWAAISSGNPTVVFDGALEGGDFVVPFSLLIVREDGMWEVFHQSTKTLDSEAEVVKIPGTKEVEETGRIVATKDTLKDAFNDAAPLMYVLANDYADYVARFVVIGADKTYVMPYPDPTTGEITVDPDDAIYWLELDYSDVDWKKYLGAENPMEVVYEMQQELSRNPFWVPEAEIGGQCGASRFGYDCPYKVYCTQEKQEGCPNHLKFNLPYHDYNRLQKLGYETMDDFLELSYQFPTGENIPKVTLDELHTIADTQPEMEFIERSEDWEDEDGKTHKGNKPQWYIEGVGYCDCMTMSIEALRELRAYEDSLNDVESEVNSFLS